MRQTYSSVCTVALLLAALLVVGCKSKEPSPSVSSTRKIVWLSDLQQGFEQAKDQDKLLFVDFFATWCGPCKQMEEQVYPNPQVVAAADKFICVKLDIDKDAAAAEKYNITGVPTMIFMKPDGTVLNKQVGSLDATELLHLMETSR